MDWTETLTPRYRVIARRLVCLLALITASSANAEDPARYAVTDLRVAYMYDSPGQIDWPTLYYLNDTYGCRIDLIRFVAGGGLYVTERSLAPKQIYRTDIHVPANRDIAVDSTLRLAFRERRPDIVLIGSANPRGAVAGAREYLSKLAPDPRSLFNIQKIYQLADNSAAGTEAVTLGTRGLYERFRDRMLLEIPALFDEFVSDTYEPPQLTRYSLIAAAPHIDRTEPDIVGTMPQIRLDRVLDSLLTDGKLREALGNRARNFIALFTLAQNVVGGKRVESVVQGYKELVQLEYQCRSQRTLADTPGLIAYLNRLVDRARTTTLAEIGMVWDGRIAIRQSPHGPKVKFTAHVSVNGPKEIELSYLKFNPYWDTAAVVLDSISRKIQPHQTYVREFLVDVDRQYLESTRPESLLFTAEIVYSRIPLTVTSSVPLRETPNLAVSFQPDYHFVPPSARLTVDKVVSSMRWKVRIDKPRSYAGPVRLVLETPRGVFAGAYRQEIQLEPGRDNEIIEIPFSVSNLFEMGIQAQTLALVVDDRVVAADTGHIRIAACEVDDTRRIAFLADTSGALEDALRIAALGFHALTDRSLWTAELDAYDVIVVGSGAARLFPSLRDAKSRLETYVRDGGSLVILGQPYDWPDHALPVSLTPEPESIRSADITNRIPAANVLSRPYDISMGELLNFLSGPTAVSSAVVVPAERVLTTSSGATLLSVSRLGDGQIIYCGLPVLEAIAQLNLEAIHLFANLLNY